MSNSIVSLNSKAMLTDVSIKVWSAKRHDKAIDAEVASRHGKENKAGRYNKNLRPDNAEHPAVQAYDRVKTVAGQARAYHYEQTLPWLNEGARILLATNYMDYNMGMRGHETEFRNAVSEFLPLYPDLVELAQGSPSVIFREEDFPSVIKIRRKFDFKRQILPLPNQYDFRVNLSEIEVKAVRKSIEEDVKEAVTIAMRDPYIRLIEGVKKMVETLSDEENNRFHGTLVENLRGLCDLVPKLNLTGDPQLEAFRQEIETGLTQFDAKDLKADKVLRKTVAERAKEIQNQLADYACIAA